jgi:hypothetical protein
MSLSESDAAPVRSNLHTECAGCPVDASKPAIDQPPHKFEDQICHTEARLADLRSQLAAAVAECQSERDGLNNITDDARSSVPIHGEHSGLKSAFAATLRPERPSTPISNAGARTPSRPIEPCPANAPNPGPQSTSMRKSHERNGRTAVAVSVEGRGAPGWVSAGAGRSRETSRRILSDLRGIEALGLKQLDF